MDFSERNSGDYLSEHGVKPTSNRILVWKALGAQQRPVSLSELEEILETLDKSSIFRALTLFLEHHLVHAFEDGEGVIKYECCPDPDHCGLHDLHVHFYCEHCRKTYCFPAAPIPQSTLPEGFTAHSINYMIKGICEDCQKTSR